MFTYDEWGNTIFHIQTGREGIKMFKEMGISNPSKEEYEKHMASYRKIKEKENQKLQEFLDKFLKYCKN